MLHTYTILDNDGDSFIDVQPQFPANNQSEVALNVEFVVNVDDGDNAPQSLSSGQTLPTTLPAGIDEDINIGEINLHHVGIQNDDGHNLPQVIWRRHVVEVELATDIDFLQDLQSNLQRFGSSYQFNNWKPNLEPDTTYFWRVRLVNLITDTTGPWRGADDAPDPCSMFVTANGYKSSLQLNLHPGWNLVSLNLAPDDPKVDTLFGDDALVLAWDPANARYRGVGRIDICRGYWVFVTDAITDLTITGHRPYRQRLKLHKGWNLIGSLGQRPVGLDAAHGIMYTVVNGTYVAIDKPEPGQTYWIYCPTPVAVEVIFDDPRQ